MRPYLEARESAQLPQWNTVRGPSTASQSGRLKPRIKGQQSGFFRGLSLCLQMVVSLHSHSSVHRTMTCSEAPSL
jgi:hypothetical protein